MIWFGLVLWPINRYRLFNAKSSFIHKPVLFKTIQFIISTVSFYTQLNVKTVLFQTIQFIQVQSLVLFTYQTPPLRAVVDLGAMAMKGYSTFPKAPALLESSYLIIQCHIQDGRCRWDPYPSTDMHPLTTDWANLCV